jgi:transcriptional regulator with XRE-family HTH domain
MAKRGAEDSKLEAVFSETLREIRKENGFSQERLALESGYHRTYVGMLERGQQNPTLRTITRLAKVLGVPATAIISRFEEKMKAQK